MILAYIRVSSIDQNLDRQIEHLSEFGIEKWYKEKKSGKNIINRPQLKKLLKEMKEGDVVYVHDLSRMARNTADLLKIVQKMNEKDVKLISCKENIDSSTITGRLILSIFASVYEFERECIKERQREGIEIAKRKGKYRGSQKRLDEDKIKRYYPDYKSGELSVKEISNLTEISEGSIYRYFRKYREQM